MEQQKRYNSEIVNIRLIELINMINNRPGKSISYYSKKTGYSYSYLAGLIKCGKVKKLICLNDVPRNKRVKAVFLTNEGEVVLELANKIVEISNG